MWYVFGVIALAMVITVIRSNRKATKLKEARHEYEKNEYALGRDAARAQCRHEFTQFGQTGVPGVITLTTKWCRVCRSINNRRSPHLSRDHRAEARSGS
jgi:hypothetical protein